MYRNCLADSEVTLPDADGALFGNPREYCLEIERLPPEERPEPLRRALDEIEASYSSGSGDAVPVINRSSDGTVTRTSRNPEEGGWSCLMRVAGKPGRLESGHEYVREPDTRNACIVMWRDMGDRGESQGETIRYALAFFNNRSAGGGEEIDLDIAVLSPDGPGKSGCRIVFNESKRLLKKPENGGSGLAAEAMRLSRHAMGEMPRYFGDNPREFMARDLRHSAGMG